MLVSWADYRPPPRFDSVPWSHIIVEESADNKLTWTQIDNIAIDPLDANPAEPAERSFSTEQASSQLNWFKISFKDNLNNQVYTEPVQYAASEILASLEDINANLDGEVVEANLVNTAPIQISVARVLRANLGQIVNTTVLYGWTTPDLTPPIIREIAAKLIAGQLYMQEVSRSGQLVPIDHFGMVKYQEGIDLLKRIIGGELIISGIATTPSDSLTELDFWPIDSTGRAFSMDMQL